MKQLIKNTDVANLICLGLFWATMMIIVHPIGSFPLNDDWAYYKDVQFYLETGKIKMVNWSAMTLISQIYLGAAWSKIFGFSFIALRFLTLIVGLGALIGTYYGVKDLTKNSKSAFLIAFLFACNPLYIVLSNSFMTDIYFYAFSVFSFYFFNRCLANSSLKNLTLATVFAVLATMTRQIGIVIPIAYLLTFLVKSRQSSLKIYIINALPLLIVGASLAFFNIWVKTAQKELETYVSFNTTFSMLGKTTLNQFYVRIGSSGLLLGLFLFPLLIFQVKNFLNKGFWKENKSILIITVFFALPLIKGWKSFPIGNVFYGLGLGPRLLKDVELLKINNEWLFSNTIKIPLYLIGFAGALIIFYNLLKAIASIQRKLEDELTVHKTFYLFLIGGYFATFIIPVFFFDRYLVQLFLPVAFICITNITTFSSRLFNLSMGWIIVYFLFSSLLTRDYFSWSRARWQAVVYLTEQMNISSHDIDGGFEFNSWYNAASDNPIILNNKDANKSWWYVDKDTYLISFNTVPNYTILKSFEYTQYLPYRKGFIYVNKKDVEE